MDNFRSLCNKTLFGYIPAMKSIDGKELARSIRAEIKKEIAEKHLAPKLGVLLVGDDPASHLYVTLKERAAKEAGIATDIKRLPAQTSDDDLKRIIEEWNKDETVSAILVQVPLPAGHDMDAIIRSIEPRKDADGFHPATVKALYDGHATIISPVHEGILRLIAATDVPVNTAHAVIIANSGVFSEPLEYLLKKAGAFVTVMPPDSLDRKTLLLAQIIVVAVGRAKLLTREHISPGAVVIDVGTNRMPNGNVVGDVDADSVKDLNGWLSPVPGGVGPMTIAMLLKNVAALSTFPSPPQARL